MKTSNKIAIAIVALGIAMLYASVQSLAGFVKQSKNTFHELTGNFKHVKIIGGNIPNEDWTEVKQARIEIKDGDEGKALWPPMVDYTIKHKEIVNDTLYIEFITEHVLQGVRGSYVNGIHVIFPDIQIECNDLQSLTLMDSRIDYKAKNQRNLEIHSFGNSLIAVEMMQQEIDSLSLYLEGATEFYPIFDSKKQGTGAVKIKNLKVVARDSVSLNLHHFECGQKSMDLGNGVSISAKQELLTLGN